MTVLLLQLDGKFPNLALMRLSAHHKAMGDSVELRHAPTVEKVERGLFDDADRVYASLIFERTRPVARRLREVRPDAIIGGSGWDLVTTLEGIGVATEDQDYSIYPRWRPSIGFSQRGCRLACPFCIVRRKEGKVHSGRSIRSIWRGEPWPREIVLLDNDFFGEPGWPERIEELRSGGFKVAFSQGVNARFLDDETAAAIASVDYRDDGMKAKRIYTAWDNRKDEDRLFRGLELLTKHGVKPDQIMVYLLVGFDHDTQAARSDVHPDDLHRRARLREFGARPYPMPYVRTPGLVGFQRWCAGAYDKRIPWGDWVMAKCEPRRLGYRGVLPLFASEDSVP
jgi:hypothetical protein